MKTLAVLSLVAAAAAVSASLTPRQDSIACTNIRCASGTVCDDTSGTAACVPQLTCSTVDCIKGSHCDEDKTTGRISCVPDTITAQPSILPFPVAAPTTLATIVAAPKVDPCQYVMCIATQSCQVNPQGEGKCVPSELVPGPVETRQTGEVCGANVCGAAEYCCNSSCGVCAAIDGGLCHKEFCQPAAVTTSTSSLASYPTA